jgi:hypothetical protein
MRSTLRSTIPEPPERPTELATLNISSSPVSITVSAQGTSAKLLTLGVIGPLGTIAVGHFAGLPVWLIASICALQIAAAMVHRWS